MCRRCVTRKRGTTEQALGRSRGGFTTKIHVVVDGLGNPLRFLLTAGNRHDITQAAALIDGYHPVYVIADRGYDSDTFVEQIVASQAEPVIPSRKRRTQSRSYDAHLYRERHLVECFINKLKYYRRVFARFDKLANRYLGFICLAATLICLK